MCEMWEYNFFSTKDLGKRPGVVEKKLYSHISHHRWRVTLNFMPHIVQGDLAVDERGTVRFVNDFNFENVKRFYQVENHYAGFIRAWHGHKEEDKYVYVAHGSALVGAVDMQTEYIQTFVLSDKKPRILWIPKNHANGFMTLEENTIVFFFSSSTIEETRDDDIRFPFDKWDIWNVEYR